MLNFMRENAGILHHLGMIGYFPIVILLVIVGWWMVYHHHVLGRSRLWVGVIYMPLPFTALVCDVVFYCGIGITASLFGRGLLLVLFAILAWSISTFVARQRHAPFAAVPSGFISFGR